MKRIIIKLLITIIVIAFSSCLRERYSGSNWTYVNSSGHEVIVSWKQFSWHNPDQFVLKDGETHTLQDADIGGSPPPFGYAKEVSVIFDNSRIIVFYDDVYAENHIMDSSGYEFLYEKKERGSTINYYQYTFTPEMYERAVPIDDAEQPEIPE